MKALRLAMFLGLGTAAVPAFAYAQAEEEVDIRVAPPAPQMEVQTVAPSAGHIWTPGHWWWNPGARGYVWSPGHWILPPQQGMAWTPAQWVNVGGYWRFAPGHWRPVGMPAPPPEQLVQVNVAPPPPQVEVRPMAPSPTHVWVPGYWGWNGGQHVWVGGRWDLPPQGYGAYAPGHWYGRGPRWGYAPGRWYR